MMLKVFNEACFVQNVPVDVVGNRMGDASMAFHAMIGVREFKILLLSPAFRLKAATVLCSGTAERVGQLCLFLIWSFLLF